MNIENLSTRTGLSMRRLRYVIEYRVLPPSEALNPGRGGAREFDDFTGFCIALAALMLETGLRRDLVKLVMETATEFRKPGFRPGSRIVPMIPVIENTYGFAKSATLEIGDGVNVRIVSDPPHLRVSETTIQPMSLPWTQMATGQALAGNYLNYTPRISVCVRIDMLARQIKE